MKNDWLLNSGPPDDPRISPIMICLFNDQAKALAMFYLRYAGLEPALCEVPDMPETSLLPKDNQWPERFVMKTAPRRSSLLPK